MSDRMLPLFSQGREVSYSSETVLFFTGDPVAQVFLVRSGAIGLRRVSEHGHEMLLQVARQGDVLAEASIYSDAYHCDAVALEESRAIAIPINLFRSRLLADPVAHELWAQQLARGVQAARARAEIRGLRTVAARVDMWLAMNKSLPEKGQRQLLAAELGVSPEALYRELAKRKAP